jgi:hypothetical protein
MSTYRPWAFGRPTPRQGMFLPVFLIRIIPYYFLFAKEIGKGPVIETTTKHPVAVVATVAVGTAVIALC